MRFNILKVLVGIGNAYLQSVQFYEIFKFNERIKQ